LSEVSAHWFQDDNWYEQKQILQKVVKWQEKWEGKFGFDPVTYFGGMKVDDLNRVAKDPRFSGKLFR
jgi:hypothetical protein